MVGVDGGIWFLISGYRGFFNGFSIDFGVYFFFFSFLGVDVYGFLGFIGYRVFFASFLFGVKRGNCD